MVAGYKQHLLIVDDDEEIRELLEAYLTKDNFAVTTVPDGARMHAVLSTTPVDLLILDVMLANSEDGLTLAKQVQKAYPQLLVLILSARGDTTDRIVGLEVGADDYLPKPFEPRELLARIRALLRRSNSTQDSDSSQETSESKSGSQEVHRFGPFSLDTRNYQLTRAGQEIPLTMGEYDLLLFFLQNPNKAFTRGKLLELTGGDAKSSAVDRSIDVRISRIRNKIEEDPSKPRYVRTVWGRGYMFHPQPDSSR